MELGKWFMTMLDELDEDSVDDADAINKLRGMVAEAFATWRLETGYGLTGPGGGKRQDP
jgi:hypothetical protein